MTCARKPITRASRSLSEACSHSTPTLNHPETVEHRGKRSYIRLAPSCCFVALLVALLMVGCGGSEDAEPAPAPGDQPGAAESADEATEDSQTDSDGDGILDAYDPDPDTAERTRETPEPDGTFKVTCDYLLGGGLDDNTFVAGGELENTGNVGIVATLTATWPLLGSDPVREERTVRLRRGQTRDVQISVPAVGSQIDAHQSAATECKTDVEIVDSFGKPPLE